MDLDYLASKIIEAEASKIVSEDDDNVTQAYHLGREVAYRAMYIREMRTNNA